MKRCSKSLFSPRRAHMAGGVSAGVGAFLRLGVAVRGRAGVPDAVFGLFQFLVFPVLLFGTGAALGLCAAPGLLRWALPALLGLLYSIWR